MSRLRNPMARLRSERGFSLVELLIAMSLSSVGVAATLGVFGASGRATLVAQQSEVAVQVAQAEIDEMSKFEYGELALTTTPTHSADPLNPRYRVNGTTFDVRADGVTADDEPLVTTAGSGSTAQVVTGPEAFSVGSGSSAISGSIYRYVTWRDERCPAATAACSGTQNTKRVIVGVTVNPSPGASTRKPVWMSTVLTDPAASGATTSTGSGSTGSPNTSAQLFYLYDTPCSFTSRQTPSADHLTRSTAATSSTASEASTCQNGNSMKNPDLMGTAAPAASDPPPPLYDYSSDLSGSYPGGLAMMRSDNSCHYSYPAGATSSAVAHQWSVHAWSTNQFSTAFILSGQLTLSIHSATLGALSGAGKVCVTLIQRSESGGVATDNVISTTTHDVSNWPTTPRRLSFTDLLPSAWTVPANRRLVLVLHVRSESTNDIAILYDHPSYPSMIEVETSTPL